MKRFQVSPNPPVCTQPPPVTRTVSPGANRILGYSVRRWVTVGRAIRQRESEFVTTGQLIDAMACGDAGAPAARASLGTAATNDAATAIATSTAARRTLLRPSASTSRGQRSGSAVAVTECSSPSSQCTPSRVPALSTAFARVGCGLSRRPPVSLWRQHARGAGTPGRRRSLRRYARKSLLLLVDVVVSAAACGPSQGRGAGGSRSS